MENDSKEKLENKEVEWITGNTDNLKAINISKIKCIVSLDLMTHPQPKVGNKQTKLCTKLSFFLSHPPFLLTNAEL